LPLFIIFCILLVWLAALLGARVADRSETARRKEALGVQLQRQEQLEPERHQRHLKIRCDARERARLAFPELLDDDEAKGFDENHAGLKELSGPDYDLIYKAKDLLREEIEALKVANPDWSYSRGIGKKLESLNEDLTTLKSADEDRGYRDLDLGTPARVIDCGTAGQVNLYTAAQVKHARKESGVADYLAFLERRARAPQRAKQIVERARLAEQKEREAEEARLASITTKLEDLPPLPAKDH
jgi:hypothetical protein